MPTIPEQSRAASEPDADETRTVAASGGGGALTLPREAAVYLDGDRVGRFILNAVEDGSDAGTLRVNARAVR
jgi:hypothetical protein